MQRSRRHAASCRSGRRHTEVPRVRPTTLRARHLRLGRATPPPADLAHYSERHGIGHLVAAGELAEARRRLLVPSGLLGLQAHPDLWPTIYPLGAALWPEGMASAFVEASNEELSHGDRATCEEYADTVLGLLRDLGAHAKGLELARTRLEQATRDHGAAHPSLAVAQHNLALALEATGALDEAVEMSRAAVRILDQHSETTAVQRATARAGLSLVLIASGRPGDAVDALEGHVHDPASTAGHNYASALREAGRNAEAIAAFESVISAREAKFGLHHPDTDVARTGLADTLRGARRPAEARAIYEELLPRQKRLLGPHHVSTESTLNGLSISLQNLEEYGLAREVLESLYEARHARLGADHAKTVMTLHNLGHNHLAVGDLVAAETCFRRVHEVDRQQLGLSHKDTAMSLSGVADVQAARGDLDGALAGWAEAAEIMLRALGPSHPNSAWAQATIGVGLARGDRIEEAMPYLEKAVEMMVAGNGGPEHQAGVRRSLAVCLEKIGRVEQCIQVVQDLCIDQRALGDEDGLGQSQLWLKELAARVEP